MQDNGGIGGRVKLFGLAAVKAGVCFGAALPNIELGFPECMLYD